jgi:hypothetical protein
VTVDTGQHALERALEQNRLYALEKKRKKRLAYVWHLMRRRREQGRLTAEQWDTWSDDYVSSLEASPWRTFCDRQRHQVRRIGGGW